MNKIFYKVKIMNFPKLFSWNQNNLNYALRAKRYDQDYLYIKSSPKNKGFLHSSAAAQTQVFIYKEQTPCTSFKKIFNNVCCYPFKRTVLLQSSAVINSLPSNFTFQNIWTMIKKIILCRRCIILRPT